MKLLKLLLPALSLAMFLCAVGIGMLRFFKRPLRPALLPVQPEGPEKNSPAPRELLRVGLLCLAAGVLFQGGMLAWAMHAEPGIGLAGAAQRLFGGSIDTRHYLNLAQYGYGAGEEFPQQYLMIVFFPLFPALLRLLNPLGSMNWYLVGMAVQLPLFACGGAALWELTRRHLGRSAANWAPVFLLACPASFFFFAPMTESLFLVLSVVFVLLLEDGRWALSGLVGLMAGLCRAPGALLCGMALVFFAGLWLRGRQRPQAGWLLPILGPASGLGLYLLINRVVYGNWFQFSIYQWENWDQKTGFFPDTVAYLLDYVQLWWTSRPDYAIYLSLAGLVCVLVQLGLLLGASARLPVHQLAYGLAYTMFTCGVSWLISAPRYAAGLFCLPMALAALCRRPWQKALALVLLLPCTALYLSKFCRGGPIY